jgi:hypothetical protein
MSRRDRNGKEAKRFYLKEEPEVAPRKWFERPSCKKAIVSHERHVMNLTKEKSSLSFCLKASIVVNVVPFVLQCFQKLHLLMRLVTRGLLTAFLSPGGKPNATNPNETKNNCGHISVSIPLKTASPGKIVN